MYTVACKIQSGMKSRTTPKETLYFKFPTYLADLAIHYGTFYLALLFSGLLPAAQVSTFGGTGAPLILFMSYITAMTVVPLRLNDRRIAYYRVMLRAVAQAALTVSVFIFITSAVYKITPVRFYIVYGFSAGCLIVAAHLLIRLIIVRIRQTGKNRLRVVMVGADENMVMISREMRAGYGIHGYTINGFFTDKYQSQIPEGERLLGGIPDVLSYIERNDLDEVYCGVNPSADEAFVNSLIHACDSRFIQFWFVPNMNGYPKRRMHYEEFGSVTVIGLREEPLNNPLMQLLKRSEDIVLSGLFLVTVYPIVWTIVAIGIKLTSPGPILFRQARTGYNGKSFECLKFRSMKVNADSDKVQATEDDPRKTRFGDFLRRTSIDELPQFINVFKGDMSIVGPRPHMEYHTELYSQLISEYMVRHLVKPGITGWAQVNGCRGETKTVEQMKERVEHDIWYIEHWSPLLDIKIVMMTVRQILGGDKQAY